MKPFKHRILLFALIFGAIATVQGELVFEEDDGLVVIEMESTDSDLGNWKLVETDTDGYPEEDAGEGHLEYQISPASGFVDAELYREAATVGRNYDGWNSLRKSLIDSETEWKFRKIIGPDWLHVAPNGVLSGIPLEADVGMSEFQVEAYAPTGESSIARLRIPVQDADVVYRSGRIVVSSDGNHHDPDDWGATTASLAILASLGLQDSLALYIHSDHIWGSSDWGGAEQMKRSAVEGGRLFGFDTKRIISGVDDPERAYDLMRDQIVRSTAEDPLVIVAAGPMQVTGEALSRARDLNPQSLSHVRCISHSTWNNRHADQPADFESHHGWTWWEMIEEFTDDGVIFDKIHDQNQKFEAYKGLSSGSAGPDGTVLWEPWYFLRDYDSKDEMTNKAIQFIWERMRASKKADISDAGMIYYLVTGDPWADPKKIEQLFDHGF
ncbi:MAG: hypothetical protein AAGJ81_00240 [Verrucomicrobiota bacterium]